MKKFLLLIVLLITINVGKAETWTPVGQVQWSEGALSGISTNYCKTWAVNVECSDSRPNVYRMQPYSNHPLNGVANGTDRRDNVYVILHTENLQEVYIEYYMFYQDNRGCVYHVFQRCPENGADSRYYGKITTNNTIEFPIGSFAVNENMISSNISYPSDVRYSSTIHKIVFPDGVLDYIPTPETWLNIGQGHWVDPVWIGSYNQPIEKDIEIEKSVQHPDRYRVKIFSDADYVIINTENPEKVYISPYSHVNSEGAITVTQNCVENGMSGSKYGILTNGKITIPGDCFVWSYSGGNTYTGSNSRICEITLPDGFDNPLTEDNGVFMGIIGFNDEITRKPISLLNEYSKGEFTSFVNELEMGNATLLYYAVDQAISSMKAQTFPENLSNAILLTFTDGLDQGSLAMKPEYRTSKGYADHLSSLISDTKIHGHSLEAYAIGLKSEDVYDDEMFMYNLQSLASKDENISPVNNIDELKQKLTELFENLNKQTTQRVVTIKVPMMSHGDKYRFTLDDSRNSVTSSNIWFEGTFNIDNMSLENVKYSGFTSISGVSIPAKQEGIKLIFTLNDCRGMDGDILDVDQNGIDQWQYIPSHDIWNHNVENAKAEDIDIQNIKSSVAIMFALDCSTSLGELFPLVQSTANSFIDRLAGGTGGSGIENLVIEPNDSIDINDPSVEIYSLQGIRVSNPLKGIYICRKGNIIKKIVVR